MMREVKPRRKSIGEDWTAVPGRIEYNNKEEDVCRRKRSGTWP